MKSYANLLRKCTSIPTFKSMSQADSPTDSIAPTMEGPYSFSSETINAPKSRRQHHLAHVKKHSSTSTHTQQRLVKKDPTTGAEGEIPAEDVQNDSEYLVEVPIGTPAQTLKLDFDTGSSDLWLW